jgi:hypothetical protein
LSSVFRRVVVLTARGARVSARAARSWHAWLLRSRTAEARAPRAPPRDEMCTVSAQVRTRGRLVGVARIDRKMLLRRASAAPTAARAIAFPARVAGANVRRRARQRG